MSRQLGGPEPKEGHDVGRAVKRIRDRLASVDRQRGCKTAVDLGDQHPAGGDPTRIEHGECSQTSRVRRGGEPQRDIGVRRISARHHQNTIAGL